MNKEVIIDIENPKDNDLISRQAVKEVFPRWKFIGYEAYLCAVAEIDALPPVRPQENTGHWIIDKGSLDALYGEVCKCSECGAESIGESDYCSYCGAKMEREDKE